MVFIVPPRMNLQPSPDFFHVALFKLPHFKWPARDSKMFASPFSGLTPSHIISICSLLNRVRPERTPL